MRGILQRRVIEAELSTLVGRGDWVVKGPVRRSRECNIYLATCQSVQGMLTLKQFHAEFNSSASRCQFEAFSAYQEMGRSCSSYRVPKVYGYLPNHRILVMEWFEGQSLACLLWKSLPFKRNRLQHIRRAGKWLRSFHEISGLSEDICQREIYLERIAKQKSATGEDLVSGSSSLSLFHKAYERLIESFDTDKADFSVATAVAHGDFTPVNILMNTDAAVGIDFWANIRAPVDLDVARMAVYLTIAYTDFPVQDIFSSKNVLCRDVAEFVRGYGEDILQSESDHFKRALLAEYLRRWLVINRRQANIKNVCQKTFQLRCVRQQVESVLRAM